MANRFGIFSRMIRASAPAHPHEFTAVATVTITAGDSAAATPAAKLPRFSIHAYSGGLMRLDGWPHPVIAELTGVKASPGGVKVYAHHDPTQIVGHVETGGLKVDAAGIQVSGPVSGTGPAAREVVANSANGFPYEASIGASPDRVEFLAEGKTATVNGNEITGPAYIIRTSTLKEVSFVGNGADNTTHAAVAAKNAKENAMNPFHKWLKASGFDPLTLNAAQTATMQAQFDAAVSRKEIDAVTGDKISAAAPAAVVVPAGNVIDAEGTVKNIRAAAAVETARINAVSIAAKTHPEILAKAIAEGWDTTKTELEVIKASRATAPAGHVITRPTDDKTIEAALCLSLKLPNIEKQFKPETLEAADRHYRNMSLGQALLLAAHANGYVVGPGERIHQGNVREVISYAFMKASGTTTLSLPGIFSNVANKELLAGYMEEDQSWREVSIKKPVNDFKTVTSYRLTDDMEYEELAPNGEIPHGSLGEESYTRQAKTYAKMGQLDRTDIINDDLGALGDLRNRIGRGGAKKFNNLFWTKFLANSSFFTTARGNYITGATTNLGTDGVGLGLGLLAFRQMKSSTADGAKRVGGRPEILLVPPELEGNADRLYANNNLASVKTSDANIYNNKYRPVVVDWLSDAAFSGYSSTAWYLLRAPTSLAACVVSFLNGVETPTIESAEADFNQLGIQFRGYHDFGVDLAEYLCGVKSKGAA